MHLDFLETAIAGSPTLQKGLFLAAAAVPVDNPGMRFKHKAPKRTMSEWFTIKTSLFGTRGFGDSFTTSQSVQDGYGHRLERSVIINPFIPCVIRAF
jgi:hypothetical protein